MTIDTAKMRELDGAATHGEWELGINADGVYRGTKSVIRVRHLEICSVRQLGRRQDENYENNFAFICAARTFVPHALDRIAELEAEVERLRGALQWYAEKKRYTVKNVTFASHDDGSHSQQHQTAIECDGGSRARKALTKEPQP